MRRRYSLGIDFNSESVSLVLLRKEWKRVSLAAHAVIPRGEGEDGDEAVVQEIARLVPPKARRSTRVSLGFPRDAAVASRLDLPPVSVDRLAQLLRFELDRHLPVSPENFRCALRVQERAADRTSGFLVALPLPLVERALSALSRAGLSPAAIDVSPFPLLPHLRHKDALLLSLRGTTADLFQISGGNLDRWRPITMPFTSPPLPPHPTLSPGGGEDKGEGDGLAPLLVHGAISDEDLAALAETTGHPAERVALFSGLLPADSDPSLSTACALALEGLHRRPAGLIFTDDPSLKATAWTKWRKPAIAAAIVLGVGGTALGSAMMVRDHLTLKSLKQEISRLEPEGKQAEAVRARRDRVKRTVDLITGFQRNEVLKIELLRELSQIIPDEAWLTGLTYRQGQVELSGLARSASALVPVLEGSAVLKGVSLEGAVTREGAQERFTLRATVRPEWRPSPETAVSEQQSAPGQKPS